MPEGNRRKFLRVSFDSNFEVKTETWSDHSASGLDISLNGCRFHCEQFLSEDETISLNFKPGFVLKGNIRWCWPIEWYYLAAVHFENISKQEQEKLKSYIEEVTGENYQMEKDEENSNEIIENSVDEYKDIEFNDFDEIDDMDFDVVGEDQNDDEDVSSESIIEDEIDDLPQLSEEDLDSSASEPKLVDTDSIKQDSIIGDKLEDLTQLNLEDLDNSVNESKLVNTDSFSDAIHQDSIVHTFAESDLNPLSFKGKSVLIFDMEKTQGEILNRYLSERLGMEVEFVSKKQNLWRHLKIDPVDLIILESGFQATSDALEVMQQTEDQFPEVNFFCISGPVSLERRMQFLNAGALDYLTRPIHLSAIAQSILVHLSRMDFYKVDLENEELDSGNNKSKTVTHNFNSAETFHDEDLTGTLDIIDEDIDISREIELIDEDY